MENPRATNLQVERFSTVARHLASAINGAWFMLNTTLDPVTPIASVKGLRLCWMVPETPKAILDLYRWIEIERDIEFLAPFYAHDVATDGAQGSVHELVIANAGFMRIILQGLVDDQALSERQFIERYLLPEVIEVDPDCMLARDLLAGMRRRRRETLDSLSVFTMKSDECERQLKIERSLARDRLAWWSRDGSISSKQIRTTREQVNIEVITLLAKRGERATARGLAGEIGCSPNTVAATDAWQAFKALRDARGGKAPRREFVPGLGELIDEQRMDARTRHVRPRV